MTLIELGNQERQHQRDQRAMSPLGELGSKFLAETGSVGHIQPAATTFWEKAGRPCTSTPQFIDRDLRSQLIARQAYRLRRGIHGLNSRSMSADGVGDDVYEKKCGGYCQKPARFILGLGSGRQSCLRRPVRNDHSRSPEFCLSSFVSKCSYWRMTRLAWRRRDACSADMMKAIMPPFSGSTRRSET